MRMSPGRRPSQGIFPPRVNNTPISSMNPPNRISALPSSVIVTLASQQLALVSPSGPGDTEVPIRAQCRHPSPGGALEIAFLEQIRFVHVLDRAFFFAEGRGDSFDADRPAGEFFDDGEQNGTIHLVETCLINFQQ